MKLCCLKMVENANTDDLAIKYDYRTISHGINFTDSKDKKASYMAIVYCPWCGVKLPQSISTIFCALISEFSARDANMILDVMEKNLAGGLPLPIG